MCISSAFCDRNLQLLFTILSKSDNPVIRSNIVIGLGDMAVCFNSLIDQNISYVYGRLHDSDFNVRKNTLMVLTHLILNGMIKVKGQISEMAKCLEDSDPRISDLARLFFTELSTKDNAVYNNLPDIISNLSSIESGLEENSFKKVMEFLFSFIKKVRRLFYANTNTRPTLGSSFGQSRGKTMPPLQRSWRSSPVARHCFLLVTYPIHKRK